VDLAELAFDYVLAADHFWEAINGVLLLLPACIPLAIMKTY